MEIEELRESFEDFSSQVIGHRLERNKLHNVEEILFLTLTAIICRCRRLARYRKIWQS